MMNHMKFLGQDKNLDFTPGAQGGNNRILKTLFICSALLFLLRCSEDFGIVEEKCQK